MTSRAIASIAAHALLNRPGHIRLRPSRNVTQRFMEFACGSTAPYPLKDFHGLLGRAGKCSGATIDDPAAVHLPADSILDKELV